MAKAAIHFFFPENPVHRLMLPDYKAMSCALVCPSPMAMKAPISMGRVWPYYKAGAQCALEPPLHIPWVGGVSSVCEKDVQKRFLGYLL